MFKAEKMTLVTIAGTKKQMPKVVGTLHDMNLFHIEDGAFGASEEGGFDIAAPMAGAPEVSEALVKTRSVMSHLGIKTNAPASGKKKTDSLEGLQKNIASLEEKILAISEKSKKLEDQSSQITSIVSELEPLSGINLDVAAYSEYKSLSVFVGYVSTIKGLKNKLSGCSKNIEIYSSEQCAKPTVAVFCDKSSSDDVHRILAEHDFSEISTKNVCEFHGKPAKLLAALSSKASDINKKKAILKSLTERLAKEYSGYLAQNTGMLEAESEKLNAPLKFASSKNAFVASGWIPAKKYAEFDEKLKATTNDAIFISREDKDFEDAPVALTDPKAVKPYEFFLDLYSLPKYTEINPTFFMFLTFPLFFGFMLGDFGYGLLTLAIFLILRNKIPPMKNLMTVLCFSSISTIIFGLAYGEFFGFEELGGYHLPHLLSRVHGAESLFTISILLGFVHVNIGFIIGFFNALNMHGLKHAVLEKASWILLEVSLINSMSVVPIILLSNPLYNFMPITAGYALLAASILMIGKGEGIKGVLELPSIVTNILSYARLMAVGLVSVILAVVVNENATAMFHSGPIGMVFATLVFVAGHTINILLGLMSPFIHSMRLHYVEFFLKFYHGGGKRYMPFGSKKAL